MHADPKVAFNSVLREMWVVLGFWLVVLVVAAWWFGLLSPKKRVIHGNAEQVVHAGSDTLFHHDTYYFSGGRYQSSEQVHSGEYSIKIPATVPYTFVTEVPNLQGSERVRLEAWFLNKSGSQGSIQLVAEVKGRFWKSSKKIAKKGQNGWQLIQGEFDLPQEVRGHKLLLYCWNSGQEEVFVDDFVIEIRRGDL